jgi:hypothetical protein
MGRRKGKAQILSGTSKHTDKQRNDGHEPFEEASDHVRPAIRASSSTDPVVEQSLEQAVAREQVRGVSPSSKQSQKQESEEELEYEDEEELETPTKKRKRSNYKSFPKRDWNEVRKMLGLRSDPLKGRFEDDRMHFLILHKFR